MNYDLVRIDRLVYVQLLRAPTVASLRALRDELTSARQEAGQLLIHVAEIPVDAEPVPPEMRGHLAAHGKYVSTLCEQVHLVIEAPGFRGAILRSAITATALLTRERNLTVHARLADAIDIARRGLGREWAAEVDALLDHATAA